MVDALCKLERRTVVNLLWEYIRLPKFADNSVVGSLSFGGHGYDMNSSLNDFEIICEAIYDKASEKGYTKKREINGNNFPKIQIRDKQLIAELLYEFVRQGVLYSHFVSLEDDYHRSHRGNNMQTRLNDYVPHYHLTEYGKKAVLTDAPIPDDPNGYLDILNSRVPNVDPVIRTYVTESILAYNIGLFLSATTAIGCASEKALLLLIEAFESFLTGEEKTNFEQEVNKSRSINEKFAKFRVRFINVKGNLKGKDKSLTENIEITFDSVFELLRRNRNAAGHPSGETPEREMVWVSLQMFIMYCERIYSLIQYFEREKDDGGHYDGDVS
jgi:hypothetical protein